MVLVEPQNPINLGTVIRAMKNMGMGRLRLVNPAAMDLDRTQISAHRTEDIVARMEVYGTLDEALSDMHVTYGFSARHRTRAWASLEMEDAVGIAACFLQRGFGIAPLAVVLTDDDAYLGALVCRREVDDVEQSDGLMSVVLYDESYLSVGIDVSCALRDIVVEQIARVGNVGYAHLPHVSVILYIVEKVEVFRLHGSEMDNGEC